MLRKTILTSALAGSFVLAACGGKSDKQADKAKVAEVKHGLTAEQASQPLVVVGGTTITLGDFAEELAEKSPYLRARYSSPQRRRELLEEMVKRELLAAEAAKRGLDKTDEVVRTRKQVMIQQMMKTEFEEKVKLGDITDQEIEAYFKSHPEEYNKPAQVRVSHILIKDEAKAKKTLKQLLDHKDDNRLFRDLTQTLSEDVATRERAGDLQFFSRPEQRVEGDPVVPAAVAEAAFKMEKIGDTYPELVKSEQGFHILKLTGKRKELTRTLEQARRPIQHKLWRERREAAVDTFVKGLRDKGNVQENWDMLKQVVIDVPPPEGGSKGAEAPKAPGAPKTAVAPKAPASDKAAKQVGAGAAGTP
jgi:peptidyl-prolyl cis-trans isomerase C